MKPPILVVVVFTLLSFLIMPVCTAQDLYLVKGREAATILLALDATPVENYAAQELQRTIQVMSGVSLRIEKNNKTSSAVQIIIGTPATQPLVASLRQELKLAGAGEEQIAVYRKGKALYLAGNSPRAALYATFTFLQEVLGARWLWPGASGEFIPRRSTIAIGNLNITQSPSFPIRSLAITGVPNGDPATDTWMARNKLNVVSSRSGADPKGDTIRARRQKGFLVRVAGHNIILPVETLKAHPEWLAEIGGKRQFHPRNASHLCWSNPALQDEVAKMVGSWWDQSPWPDVIHFYPADQTQYCTCTDCKAMGDISTRWQKFSAVLLEKLNKTHPGKKYWTYAYLEYKTVPNGPAAPFDFIAYTLYDASYRHPLSGNSPYNKEPLAEIDGWLGKQGNLGIRGYEYIIFKPPMFSPTVSWVLDQLRWMGDKKLTGYLSELPAYDMPRDAQPENTYWNCSRMSLYAVAKGTWNNRLTTAELVQDWCQTVYGPAAPHLAAYYQDMEKAWLGSRQKISVFTQAAVSYVDSFLSTSLLQRCYQHFDRAATTLATVKDTALRNRIAAQVALEKKMLDNWQQIYAMKHLRDNPFKTAPVLVNGRDTASNKRILLFDKGVDSGPLSVELQQAGWDVAIDSSGSRALQSLLAANPAVVMLRYKQTGAATAGLPAAFLSSDIKSYVEKGGLLILAADGVIPVQEWFPGTPAVEWLAGRRGTVRRASFVQPGNWLQQPHVMQEIFHKGVTPMAAYKPLSAGWDTLASIPAANGHDTPFLLRRKFGKGTIVLTSAPMSYGGGFEMLGNRNTGNVVKLIENLSRDY